jgi:hypothetical protein
MPLRDNPFKNNFSTLTTSSHGLCMLLLRYSPSREAREESGIGERICNYGGCDTNNSFIIHDNNGMAMYGVTTMCLCVCVTELMIMS